MNKVLLTGASGAIGIRAKQMLEEEGYKVFCIKHDDIKSFTPYKAVSIEPDYIIHLSAYGNRYDQKDDREIVKSNITDTFTLLHSLRNINYKGFINVSSSSVYGKKSKPMKETDTLDTDTWYGATKVASEYLCRAEAVQNKKPVINVRPFTVYGPYDHGEGKLLTNMMSCISSGNTLYINPDAAHDFIYVDDFVSAVIFIMKNIDKFGTVVNVGSGKSVSNAEFVDTFCDVNKVKLNVEYVSDGRSYDSKTWVCDTKQLKDKGFKNLFNLKRGVKKTLEQYYD